MVKMDITLRDEVALALGGIAKVRGVSREAMAEEIVEAWLESIGAIDGDLIVKRLTPHTPPAGRA